MACPQPDIFTKFSNEYLDALCRAPFLPYHVRCWFFISRMTWGHQRTWAEIRNRDFIEATWLSRQNVNRAIRQLIGANAVVVTKDYKKNPSYRIQKDYDLWGELPSTKIVYSHVTQNVARCDYKTESHVTHTPIKEIKERKKAAENSADPPADPPSGDEKAPAQEPEKPPVEAEPPAGKKPPAKREKKPKSVFTDWPPDFALKNGMPEYAVAQGYDLAKIDDLFESWRLACDSRGYRYKNWVSAYQKMCRDDWDAHKKYKAPEDKQKPVDPDYEMAERFYNEPIGGKYF